MCPPQATRKWRNEEGHFLAEKGKAHSECTKTDEHKEIVYNTLFEDVMNGQEALRRLTTGDESVIESSTTRKERLAREGVDAFDETGFVPELD